MIFLTALPFLILYGCNQSSSGSVQSNQVVPRSTNTPFVPAYTATTMPLPINKTPSQSLTVAVSASIPISLPWGGITLDDNFVYWVDDAAPTSIKALNLTDPAQVEVVAEGSFADGVVANMMVSRDNRWLVFWDRETRYPGGLWKLQALDRMSGQQKVILENSGAPYETRSILSLGFIWVSLDRDKIALSYALEPEANECQRVVMRVISLENGDSQMIKEVNCAKEDTIWVWPQLYGDSLVFDHDRSITEGGGLDVVLYDLAIAQWRTLTDDHLSSQPQISADFIIWKRAYRSDYGKSIGVYDRKSSLTYTIDFPTQFPQAHLSNQWVYWLPGGRQSLYVYDLKQATFVLVATSECTQSFNDIAMRGSIIAWERSAGVINDSVLEWKDVTNLPAGEFVACR